MRGGRSNTMHGNTAEHFFKRQYLKMGSLSRGSTVWVSVFLYRDIIKQYYFTIHQSAGVVPKKSLVEIKISGDNPLVFTKIRGQTKPNQSIYLHTGSAHTPGTFCFYTTPAWRSFHQHRIWPDFSICHSANPKGIMRNSLMKYLTIGWFLQCHLNTQNKPPRYLFTLKYVT